MFFTSFDDSTNHVGTKRQPGDSDHQVDRPFELGILFPGSKSCKERDGSAQNNELPQPEMNFSEQIIKQSRLQYSLQGVISSGKHRIPNEGKDDRIGMHRPNPSKGGKLQSEVENRECKLKGDNQSYQKGDCPPNQRCEDKIPHQRIVVIKFLNFHK